MSQTDRKYIRERSEDFVLGCTDPYAENYDVNATHDDGSCSGYPFDGELFISFDGVDDYVELPDNFGDDIDQITIQLWIKASGEREAHYIMGQTGWQSDA